MPATDFNIREAVAYVDTLCLHSRQPLPKQVFKDVRRLQDGPIYSKKVPIYTADGLRLGYHFFVFIHQPTTTTLDYLTPMQGKKFILHAVHVAVDFLVKNEQQARHAQQYFCQRLRQNWRRPQDCTLELNCV